jgi:hypothetical protein
MEFFGETNESPGRLHHQVYWSADSGLDTNDPTKDLCKSAETYIQATNTASEANVPNGSTQWSDSYHVFAVRIQQPDSGSPTYTFFVNGKQLYNGKNATNGGPFGAAGTPRIVDPDGVGPNNGISGLILTNVLRDRNNFGPSSVCAPGSDAAQNNPNCDVSFDVDWVQTWRMPR